MYSLYRAWLCSSMPPLNLTAPTQLAAAPDVNLQVGPGLTNFSAHKSVLAAHSGFFKAALATTNGMGPILVPNINVDEFSSLLTFMYTGYLDLNLTNIYNILLATHILHMPRALEICRSFLVQSHPLEQRINSTNIIKPIPSRKPAMPHQEIHPPILTTLEKSETTPFKPIETAPMEISPPQASTSKEPDVDPTIDRKEKRIKRRDIPASNEKVIIDIACCDGPVRFHRVINKNYGQTNSQQEFAEEKINRNEVLNKVMNENIKQLADENQSGGEVFTCLYCNHTFKSQYCYQKHARRHLNPVSVDGKGVTPETSAKREVKLLDMNVQYYPCKTCGSKFPSYYFVHKHRKLCHAEEMADGNNKNNEIVQVQAQPTPAVVEDTSSSRNSIIDVEETDNN